MTQLEAFYSSLDEKDFVSSIRTGLWFTETEARLEAFLRVGMADSAANLDYSGSDDSAIWREHCRSELLNVVLANLRLSIEAYYVKNKKGAAPVVVTTPAGEKHDLGAKVTTALLRLKGFNARFTGADLPAKALLSLVDSVNPAAVVFSVAHHVNLVALKDTVSLLRKSHPQLLIAVGGAPIAQNAQAFKEVEAVFDHEVLYELIRGELR
ncbi:cobalamin B12-binding domain-containing protein [Acidaminobacter hydrogenoformans]|uniref:B12 binding domain-containing protein n=1 Tax=Acidaminobacter hydrogenoformans DSM 2784 TaxID=1120920 RepID=A0A1G5S556_9FIRM|nr:cobalamin B12-binding domain-containing protein [Acidaminobacter hydrogenoformans]SCZ81485.1 B12 binding domain-containing protein [Acidaminobacter hydrogenoformans DSM 2784]